MPFGAMIDDGGVLFQLWAPAAKRVDLRLAERNQDAPMRRAQEGWFHLGVPNVGGGALYQFVIDGKQAIPDPASRYQPHDVNGPSQVIDAEAFDWDDAAWRGRPWRESVIYELHVGTFTREGTFAAAEAELERLVHTGITAIELMPLADFAGTRNWGYDGVLLFAPDSSYGKPEDLKHLIAAAHRLGLMVFLDVVYNHFGPEGNYLSLYAPQFFAPRETGWGQEINFGGEGSLHVRRFFMHNALYWLTEYNFDGLRFDAVHAIRDDSDQHFLAQLAAKVRQVLPDRQVHLVLENDRNEARYLERDARGVPVAYDAQWNDDFHHAAHVALTDERDGYYADYTAPLDQLGRCLTEGFAYQGEFSPHREAKRGEPSRGLPLLAFVNFLQNHDQIGNRAFGERLTTLAPPEAVTAAAAVLLLAPSPPLLFMGEEWGATTPFLFFCDFDGDLASAVRDGRRREFAKFPAFSTPDARDRIPDPLDIRTFERSRLDRPGQYREEFAEHYRSLLALRHREIVPRVAETGPHHASYRVSGRVLTAQWQLADGSALGLAANLGPSAAPFTPLGTGWRRLWGPEPSAETIGAWTVIWSIRP
jgi:malto-oligosyltrehalose trehalohydrolase